MSVVRINAITVPAEHADELVQRFANRAGEVAKMPGFEAFELLRPTDGRDTFYVYTRWRSASDFEHWLNSPAFQHGHRAHHAQGADAAEPGTAQRGSHGQGPVGTGSEVLAFDVVREERTSG